jgi:sugar transferase EpsL
MTDGSRVRSDRRSPARGYDRVKRVIDVAGAGALLVCTAPVTAAVAISVWRDVGRPVLYCQQRPGLHGRPFTLRKFRTMRDAHDARGRALPDEQRLTRRGTWLRSSSLDELPELWNVLVGEMSLVGPRPLLTAYLERYSPEQARRHEVRPGVTGWAQVNGRNDMPWDDKLAMDVWYVDNRSFLLDLRILARTVAVVLLRRGVTLAGHATTVEFFGASVDDASGPVADEEGKA